MLRILALMGLLVGFSAAANPDFDAYLQQLRQQAQAQGISEATLNDAFSRIAYVEKSVSLDRAQPERKTKLYVEDYLTRVVPASKVFAGQQQLNKHRALLTEIGAKYGVQPRFIVALWGIETNFGGYTGNFGTLSVLATLAYDGRREQLFRENFLAALEIIDQGHISAAKMRGSWAGAMGQVQFMPKSFLAYAVDYDGDGRKDIWGSMPDAFASAANYLATVGWNGSQTWGRQVQVPTNLSAEVLGLEPEKRRDLSQWQALGVRRVGGSALPQQADMQANLVMPDSRDGRGYLAYDNYRVLMDWNRSTYFVTSVGYLADQLRD